MPSHFYPKVSIVIASIPDDGMQVHVDAGRSDSEPLPDGLGATLLKFRAEEEGRIRAVFDVRGETVEVPLEEIERAIHAAREDVHAESFYPYPEEPDV